jgi:stage II sporulation protein D
MPDVVPLDELAPRPRVRVGLTTAGEVVRLTAAQPFNVALGDRQIRTHDVLIEMEPVGGVEGIVFRIQVASFLDRERAQERLASFREETGTTGRVVREPVSGRFAVRVGHWTTESGAAAAQEELIRLGYEGLRIVSEPSTAHRPRRLVLRAAGASALYTSAMSLVAWPGSPGAWIEVDEAPYRGIIEIQVNPSNLFTVVNELNLEDYLKGVVPAELSPAVYPQREAIKAQAVAARTYVEKHRGQFAAEGFDICDTASCQVYGGAGVEQLLSNEAVEETRGQVLTYQGSLIDALYTSTCGGRTEDVENVFHGPAQPYLVSQPCYAEEPTVDLESRVTHPLSPEAAGALILGVVTEEELTGLPLDEPATWTDFARWTSRAFADLGQRTCALIEERSAPVSTLDFSRALATALCWEGRLPFLLSEADTERLVPESDAPGLSGTERRMMAYWIQEGVLRPQRQGLDARRELTRGEMVETLYRLLASRGEPPLTGGRFRGAEEGRLLLEIDDSEEGFPLAARRYLFRDLGEWTYFSPALSLLPDDQLQFHEGPEGIDLIVQMSRGGNYDRSSRFSRWVERKTNDDLSVGISEERAVGSVTELRPIRYGRSGRVAELEVVGTRGSIVLSGLDIRRRLGIRENLFFVDRQQAPDGHVAAWVFSGRGWGHGVGLCQVGAYGMAAAGHSYQEILAHYYTGVEVHSAVASGAR